MLKLLTALLSIGLCGSSAFANSDGSSSHQSNLESFTAQLSSDANQKQLRRLLAQQGYIVTSELVRDSTGLWSGTALKDGKTLHVALKFPVKVPEVPVSN